MGNKPSKIEYASDVSIVKLEEKIPLRHITVKSFSGERFLYLEPLKPVKWLDFIIEIKKVNLERLNEVLIYEIEIPIDKLSDYRREDTHLLEYVKEINKYNSFIIRYEHNMDIKEIVIKTKLENLSVR